MSKFQDIVGSALRFWFPDQVIHENYRPPWLFGMELDFYIPGLGIAIEVRGKQHYAWVPELQKKRADFKAQRKRDQRKHALCVQRRIRLLVARKVGRGNLSGLPQKLGNSLRRRIPRLPPEIMAAWREHAGKLQALNSQSARNRLLAKQARAVRREEESEKAHILHELNCGEGNPTFAAHF